MDALVAREESRAGIGLYPWTAQSVSWDPASWDVLAVLLGEEPGDTTSVLLLKCASTGHSGARGAFGALGISALSCLSVTSCLAALLGNCGKLGLRSEVHSGLSQPTASVLGFVSQPLGGALRTQHPLLVHRGSEWLRNPSRRKGSRNQLKALVKE